MKFKVDDEVYIKGKIVYIGGDMSAPYHIQTELYIDDHKKLWGDDSDLVAIPTNKLCSVCGGLRTPEELTVCTRCGKDIRPF